MLNHSILRYRNVQSRIVFPSLRTVNVECGCGWEVRESVDGMGGEGDGLEACARNW